MFQYSGADFNKIIALEEALKESLSKDITISNQKGIIEDIDTSKWMDDPLPVVILISGAGGNGKDTFINYVNQSMAVYNLSTIDPIKEVASTLINLTVTSDYSAVDSKKEMDDKSDRYREFLHELKMAWSKFNDGPNINMLEETRHVLTMHEDERERYDVIFIHVREAKEIACLKKDIERHFGIACLTMCVQGLVDPSSYENECDKNVNEYAYDLYITNTDLEILKIQAMFFAARLENVNKTLGIPCCYDHSHENDAKVTTMLNVKTNEVVTDDTIHKIVNAVKTAADEEVPNLAGFHTDVDPADLA